MRPSRSGTSAASAKRILATNRRTIGKSLAFGGRGTYNPASREKGWKLAFESVTPSSRCPARKPGIPKQDPDAEWSSRNAVAASFRNTFPRKAVPQKIQGAILMKKILLTVVLGIAVGAAAQSSSQPAPGQPATQGQTPAQGQPATTPAAGQAQAPAQTAPAAAPVIKILPNTTPMLPPCRRQIPTRRSAGWRRF
jgi:hypothetical protein